MVVMHIPFFRSDMDSLIELLLGFLRMFDRTSDLQLAVTRLDQKVTTNHHEVITTIGGIMADQAQFEVALNRIEAATNKGAEASTAIGTRIGKLEDAIKNAGLTKEQEQALLAQTQGLAGSAEALATALTAMGKDPANPVPIDPDPIPVDPIK